VRSEVSCFALTKNLVRYVFQAAAFMARQSGRNLIIEFCLLTENSLAGVSGPLTSASRFLYLVFCGSEGHCTSESECGQFSIFGASEEKNGGQLGGITRGEEEPWEGGVKPCGGDVSARPPLGKRNSAAQTTGISTEGAQEMQKVVADF